MANSAVTPTSFYTTLGRTDGVAPSAGYVGQEIRSYASSVSVGAGYTTVTSVTLTPGVWDMSFVILGIGVAGSTYILAGIATVTNSATGYVTADNYAVASMTGATTDVSVSIPQYRVNITSSTTYYLTASRGGATGGVYGRLSAVRIA